MRHRTWLSHCLVAILATALAGCQLPPLLKQAEKPLEQAPTSEVSNKRYQQSLGSGKWVRTATDSVWVPDSFDTQALNPDITIQPYQSWEADIPTSSTLDLYSRIHWRNFASGSGVMQVSVNGHIITDHPINQPAEHASYFRRDTFWLVYFIPSFFWNIALNYSTGYGPILSTNDPDSQLCRYVWDITPYITKAPTMKVHIYNDQTIIGQYQKGFEQPIIVRLNQKPSLELKIDTPFFSPNQDGTLDTAAGSIKAQGEWKLSVVDRGEITTGTGDAPLSWDGTVKGMKLPDGEYTLRLEDANNPSSKAEGKVVIDTTPPTAKDLKIEMADGLSNRVAVSVIAEDPRPTGSHSGLDERSIQLEANGKNLGAGHTYDSQAQLAKRILGPEELVLLNIPLLSDNKVTVSLRDKAGVEGKYEFAIDDQYAVSTSVSPTIPGSLAKQDRTTRAFARYSRSPVGLRTISIRPLIGQEYRADFSALRINRAGVVGIVVVDSLGNVVDSKFSSIAKAHVLVWDAKRKFSKYYPVDDGNYFLFGFVAGIFSTFGVEKIYVDNRVEHVIHDGTNPQDFNKWPHIVWGSKGSIHRWNEVFSYIPLKKPNGLKPSDATTYFRDIAEFTRTTLPLAYVSSESQNVNKAGMIESVVVTREKTILDLKNTARRVTVKSARRYNQVKDIIIEDFSDAWVN